MKFESDKPSLKFCQERANELIKDKHSKPFVYMIGKENGLSEKQIDRKLKKDLKEMVVHYLMKPMEIMESTSNKGMRKMIRKKRKTK